MQQYSHPAIPSPRRILASVVLLLLSLQSVKAQPGPVFLFRDVAVVGHHVGRLSWDSVAGAEHYQLLRRYPDQEFFVPIATLTAPHYVDTLRRVICADTVSYLVHAQLPDTLLTSDTAGLFFQDNIPTAACALRLCSVDTTLRRILLSWYPSPDTDVMGYYICSGSPCLQLDTVWGRLNTTYLCPDSLSPDSCAQYSFRILAFDSCLQASPLTPYFHNPALCLTAPPCSRRLSCTWNRYINMPDSVARYTLHYRLGSGGPWLQHTVGPQGPFQFDTLIADLSTSQVSAYLSVRNTPDSLEALSMVFHFAFPQPDTALYSRILAASYDDTLPAIVLSLQIDPDYPADSCLLMRSAAVAQQNGLQDYHWSPFEPLVTLYPAASADPQQIFSYTDRDLTHAVPAYSYRLAVPDRCAQRHTTSDTVVVLIPPAVEPDAWIPNIIKAGDPDLGRLCPTFPSPLSQDYCFEIYNRHGHRLFRTHDLADCWDGCDLQHRPQPQGVYVYRITCRHSDGTKKTYTGAVTLLR